MSNVRSLKSDEHLWSLLQKNNELAFAELYQRYFKPVYYFGLKLTSDQELLKDCTQELFCDFWQNRSRLPEVKNVRIYIFRSFRYILNRSLSKLNTKYYEESERLFIEMPVMESIDESPSLIKLKLKKGLLLLPTKQKEIIHLRYYENLSNEEIAEITQIKYQSVSNLLYRAIKKLKSKLTQERSIERRLKKNY